MEGSFFLLPQSRNGLPGVGSAYDPDVNVIIRIFGLLVCVYGWVAGWDYP